MSGPGESMPGKAWRGESMLTRDARADLTVRQILGMAWPGKSGQGRARPGVARKGTASQTRVLRADLTAAIFNRQVNPKLKCVCSETKQITNMKYEPDKPICKSYVWHNDKCYFVSTIERTYDTYEGETRGQETIVWEYDWKTSERGKMLHQAGHVGDHQQICRCIIAEGLIPNEDDERTARFLK